jgi:hypothetical protein
MEICKHIISDEQVIGISPFYRKEEGDPAMRALYNAHTLTFEVITKHNSVTIKSNTIYEGTASTEKHSIEFQREYVEAYKNIWVMTGGSMHKYPDYIVKFEESLRKYEADVLAKYKAKADDALKG